MADLLPQFEVQDDLGSTSQFVGTVDTTSIPIPSVAGKPITDVLVRCPTQTPNTKQLLYSFDGGVNFSALNPGEFVGWSLKGLPTQIFIKGSVASVNYEVLINREP